MNGRVVTALIAAGIAVGTLSGFIGPVRSSLEAQVFPSATGSAVHASLTPTSTSAQPSRPTATSTARVCSSATGLPSGTVAPGLVITPPPHPPAAPPPPVPPVRPSMTQPTPPATAAGKPHGVTSPQDTLVPSGGARTSLGQPHPAFPWSTPAPCSSATFVPGP